MHCEKGLLLKFGTHSVGCHSNIFDLQHGVSDYLIIPSVLNSESKPANLCSSHRSRSVYICNMRHWQVLQLHQYLHGYSAAVPATVTATMAAPATATAV